MERKGYVDNGLFVDVTQTMHANRCAASNITDPQNPKRPYKLRFAKTMAATSDECVREVFQKYLPFHDFLQCPPVPLETLTYEDRFSHMPPLWAGAAPERRSSFNISSCTTFRRMSPQRSLSSIAKLTSSTRFPGSTSSIRIMGR